MPTHSKWHFLPFSLFHWLWYRIHLYTSCKNFQLLIVRQTGAFDVLTFFWKDLSWWDSFVLLRTWTARIQYQRFVVQTDSWPITAWHSRKLGDFLIENRTCSAWTIKWDDLSGRQIRPIFAWQATDFCWPILLADEIGQLYRSSGICFMLCSDSVNCLVGNGLQFSHPLHHLGKSAKDLPVLAIDSFRHMYVWRHNPQTDIEWVGSATVLFVLNSFVVSFFSTVSPSPVWVRWCRIGPPCFLAGWCKRCLNQVVFVPGFFCLLLIQLDCECVHLLLVSITFVCICM